MQICSSAALHGAEARLLFFLLAKEADEEATLAFIPALVTLVAYLNLREIARVLDQRAVSFRDLGVSDVLIEAKQRGLEYFFLMKVPPDGI